MTWWIAALDEQLVEANPSTASHRSGYLTDRDADEFGGLVPAVLWLRDRASHQLPFTVGRDQRSFFDPKPGGLFHISGVFNWLPTEEIRPGKPQPLWEAIYEKQFADRGVLAPLARITTYFRRLLETIEPCAIVLQLIAQDRDD